MCLLVIRKTGAWLPTHSEFARAWNSNPDGFGVAYSQAGKITIQKTLCESTAWNFVQQVPKNCPALFHWRFATHGSKSPENCHPFPCIKGNWVGAHNGVLDAIPCLPNKTDSETYLASLHRVPTLAKIEKDIQRFGYGKIALLSRWGELLIANEHLGNWRTKEVWESNSGLNGYGSGLPSRFWERDDWWEDEKEFCSPRLTRLSCSGCGDFPEFSDGEKMYCGQCAETLETLWNSTN